MGLAELIVGKDWTTIGPVIQKMRGWTEMSKMILAKAPRRMGKSIAVGMIVIALAIICPGITQSIFSTGRRASRNLLEICYKHLSDLGLADREVRFNMEELFVKDPLTGKISKIFCYPSNSKIGTRSLPFPPPDLFFASLYPTIYFWVDGSYSLAQVDRVDHFIAIYLARKPSPSPQQFPLDLASDPPKNFFFKSQSVYDISYIGFSM
jgi:hypothetical protein